MNLGSRSLQFAVLCIVILAMPHAAAGPSSSEQECNQVNFQVCLNSVGSGVSNGGGL